MSGGRRGRGGGGEADFAHSLADLMSGVAVTFLVLAAIFMVQASRATQEARDKNRTNEALAQQNKESADRFAKLEKLNQQGIEAIRTMREGLLGVKDVKVDYDDAQDPQLLTIVFQSESVRFRPGECRLSDDDVLRETLRRIFPAICAKVNAGLEKSIALEGHTDNQPPLGVKCKGVRVAKHCYPRSFEKERCRKESFEANVQLSSNRAVYIFNQAHEALAGDRPLVDCLERYFLAAGRGPVDPVDGLPWEAPRTEEQGKLNRRVVIKVRVTAPFDPAKGDAP